jgi:glycosyltransferase involved in cell wall biosynthesis
MKFSIITPTYNCEKYLPETIESIISQKGKFDVELIFVDNLSSDNTRGIIEHFMKNVNDKLYPIRCDSVIIKLIAEKDEGMYDAINKGFHEATGDIYAWANSDDVYFPGAFDIVANVFNRYQQIQWLKGITSYIDEDSKLTRFGNCYLYDRNWIKNGIYGRKLYFIQQSSTFWRPGLWKKVGGLDSNLKLAGDFGLWIRFAQHTPLYSLNYHTACFRFRKGQLSEDKTNYFKECDSIIPLSEPIVRNIDRYKNYRSRVPSFLKPILYWFFLGLHRFYLVDIIINHEYIKYTLKKFRLYEFWGTRF